MILHAAQASCHHRQQSPVSLPTLLDHFLKHNDSEVPALLAWNYARSLHEAETNVLPFRLDLGTGPRFATLKTAYVSMQPSLLDQLQHPNREF